MNAALDGLYRALIAGACGWPDKRRRGLEKALAEFETVLSGEG